MEIISNNVPNCCPAGGILNCRTRLCRVGRHLAVTLFISFHYSGILYGFFLHSCQFRSWGPPGGWNVNDTCTWRLFGRINTEVSVNSEHIYLYRHWKKYIYYNLKNRNISSLCQCLHVSYNLSLSCVYILFKDVIDKAHINPDLIRVLVRYLCLAKFEKKKKKVKFFLM